MLNVTESDTLEFCDWQEATTELKAEGAIEHIFTVKDVQSERHDEEDIPAAARELLRQFADVFREELPEELPLTRTVNYSIDTGDLKPINLNAYPLSPMHLNEQREQIAKMLQQGLIKESVSPWGFPVLFVKKPGGK